MLDLRRLRLLHELHRLGTVSAVADALSYSPSTVSQQLRVLEREADLAAAAAGAVEGVVHVGSFQTASLRLLLPAMNALRERHPGVRVRLVEAEPEPALEALRSHALDLVLADEWAGTPHPRWPGLDREDLFTEPLRVALPSAHPLA